MRQRSNLTLAAVAIALAAVTSVEKAKSQDASASTATVTVWEIVTPFREYVEPDGRLKLLADGTTQSGLQWSLDQGVLKLGPSGSAKFYNDGLYARGKWPGGQHLNGRLLMSNASLATEPATNTTVSETAGQTWVGNRPDGPIANSIVDLWEFIATVPRTNKLIRLTVDLTEDKQVLDGDCRIGTYMVQRRAVSINFIDAQFGKIVLVEKSPNVLSGRSRASKGQAWNLQLTRVQKQSLYRNDDKTTKYMLFTNNRVNSPRYTPDFDSTWHWYFYADGSIRRLWLRNDAAVLSPDGRQWTMSGQKADLVEGTPPKP
jgi:hypothetical protein